MMGTDSFIPVDAARLIGRCSDLVAAIKAWRAKEEDGYIRLHQDRINRRRAWFRWLGMKPITFEQAKERIADHHFAHWWDYPSVAHSHQLETAQRLIAMAHASTSAIVYLGAEDYMAVF